MQKSDAVLYDGRWLSARLCAIAVVTGGALPGTRGQSLLTKPRAGAQVTPGQVCSPLQLPCQSSGYSKDSTHALQPRLWAWPGPDQSRRDGIHSGPHGGLWPPSSHFVLQTPAGTSLAKPHSLYEKTRKAAPPLCLSLSSRGPHRGVKAKGPPPPLTLLDARSTDPFLPGAPVTEARPAPASPVLQQNQDRAE